MMADFNLVKHHVQNSIRAAIAESSGNREEADRLRAQGNLRLIVMSDEQLRDLATMLSWYPSRPPEVVYVELKKVVEEQKKIAHTWIRDLTARPLSPNMWKN